ncbi:MAG: CBS domain-containing protein [Burkholderiales bacterium]
MNTLAALPLMRAEGQLSLPHPGMPEVPRVSPNDPAVSVMTDFTKNAIFSIGEGETIDQALLYMKAVGVRFLFVLNGENRMTGLVTSTDIQGEKPLRYLQSVDCTLTSCSREDVLVRHVMIPVEHWEVSHYLDVEKARVSQVVESFRIAGRRHLVVTENGMVRGIFSATRVEQALGIRLDIVRTARSFAEIESALLR